MMTKAQFCRKTIEDFCRDEEKDIDDLTESDCLKSTSVGIAMEYLGLIHDEILREYLSSRSGCFVGPYYDTKTQKVCTISFREFLSFLPE